MKNPRSQERTYTLCSLIILHIVGYYILLTYFRTNWSILIYGVIIMSLFFLFLEGYRFRKEVRMAYLSSFFTFGMAFGLSFFTSWFDRHLLSIGFIALQMGIYKFLAGEIMLKIPFKVRRMVLN
ncbi:hypothetical protein Bcop_1519 [Bacteroides coprosuis DSM 18011]|uniref:Transmembrane protein n=1 Tax=Bacteroides coprosuis DSM 18011 TaxID=679937 RepID=F3ZQ47_9BACE|nr:hypothetical protein [Bacteroides coprosuis]EGJ71713.1 hypothetical protein Bcop_1519 [Bacteroides coprosuis DSM 18011]